ncbi:MAG: enoyl-CoA hydratase/isomerase family protein [Proteobacteria bacterium]|nr:enoyl-CoA hydratase/isomerase family protein [Pseudomonadota bacterium]
MGAEDHVVVEREGKVATVRLCRPKKKNALSLDMLERLTKLARGFADDPGLSVVILTGQPEFFTAGMDLSDPRMAALANASLQEKRITMEIAPRACRAWESLPQTTLTAVEGFCVGGGLSLAVSTDYIVMGESAWTRAPEIDWGMNMSWGTLPRLVRLVGPARTKRMIILAEKVGAAEALAWGLAQWTAPDGKALETALSVAKRAAEKPLAPSAMTKETVNALADALAPLASHMDRDQFLLSVLDPEAARKINGFGEK